MLEEIQRRDDILSRHKENLEVKWRRGRRS